MTLSVPNYLNGIQRAKQMRAMEEMRRWTEVILRKFGDKGFPQEMLMRDLAKEIDTNALDPWGHDYVYGGRIDGGFTLRCLGKDGLQSPGITPETRDQFNLDIIMVTGQFVNKPIQ